MPGPHALDILRLELKFLELGLYRARTPGRPLQMFQDSPSCPRYGASTCPNCALMQFVPSECRSDAVPCQQIQLNDARETVDSLYRTGTQEELDEVVGEWLRATIKKLEMEQTQSGDLDKVENPDES